MADVIGLFPLGHVLLPGAPLPLRIFEERYVQLMQDVRGLGRRNCFGVVGLTRGIEVSSSFVQQEPEFSKVGTLAQMLDAKGPADGPYAVFAVGSRRFRILNMVDNGKLYLQARVEYLDEPDGVLPDTLPDSARALAIEYARLLGVLTGSEQEREPYPDDASELSYRIAQEAPLVPSDLQALLETRTAGERLGSLVRLLRREVVLLRHTRSVAVPSGALQAALRAN